MKMQRLSLMALFILYILLSGLTGCAPTTSNSLITGANATMVSRSQTPQQGKTPSLNKDINKSTTLSKDEPVQSSNLNTNNLNTNNLNTNNSSPNDSNSDYNTTPDVVYYNNTEIGNESNRTANENSEELVNTSSVTVNPNNDSQASQNARIVVLPNKTPPSSEQIDIQIPTAQTVEAHIQTNTEMQKPQKNPPLTPYMINAYATSITTYDKPTQTYTTTQTVQYGNGAGNQLPPTFAPPPQPLAPQQTQTRSIYPTPRPTNNSEANESKPSKFENRQPYVPYVPVSTSSIKLNSSTPSPNPQNPVVYYPTPSNPPIYFPTQATTPVVPLENIREKVNTVTADYIPQTEPVKPQPTPKPSQNEAVITTTKTRTIAVTPKEEEAPPSKPKNPLPKAASSVPVVHEVPFKISQVKAPAELIINQVPGTIVVAWDGYPTPPLILDMKHIECPHGATCIDDTARLKALNNEASFRYLCAWNARGRNNTGVTDYDIVLGLRIIDNQGFSSPQASIKIHCKI